MNHTFDELQSIANELRRDVIEMCPRSGNSMHVGPAFSCADILTVLYYEIMNVRPEEPRWNGRDRCILSKGHAAPILYALLARKGYYSKEELWNCKNTNSMLQGHPSMHRTPGLDSTSGSLGNGLSIGLGQALGLKQKKINANVYVIIGDGEMQEGMILEAMLAAPAKKADNLVAIVDYNHYQSSGSVEDIMPLHSLREKWQSCGWRVFEIDGHNIPEIYSRLQMAKNYEGRPTCIIAHTIKGKGVSFMEHNNKWHAGMPTPEQYAQAMIELSGKGKPEDYPYPDPIKPKTPVDMDVMDRCGPILSECLLEYARKHDGNLAISAADSVNTMALGNVLKEFPGIVYNMGIAEQDAMGVGSGLASMGLKGVVCGFAPFMTMRAIEQFRTFIAYPNLNVMVAGALGGLSSDSGGPTHQGIEDMGIMRMIPNTVVAVPCDAVTTKAAISALLEHEGPSYVRLAGFGPVRRVFEPTDDFKFEIGKANIMREGTDVTIICNGGITANAVEATNQLEEQGFSVQLINMVCLKPIDKDAILEAAKKTGCIVTAEEHQIKGGLGSAVAEVIVENDPIPMKFVGLQDTFARTGKYNELMEHYHMGVNDIVEAAKEVMKRK